GGAPREGALDGRGERRGHVAAAPGERPEGALVDPPHELDHVLADERRLAGETLVEDRSEREDVGRGSDVALARHLLGGHVAGGPAELARPRELDAPAGAVRGRVEV